MMRNKSIKRETTHNGTLRTRVSFFRQKPSDDFYESDTALEEEFSVWAEVYDMTFSDMEDLKGRFSKNALALESVKSKAIKSYVMIKLRDPMSDFQPTNSDVVKILDNRYRHLVFDVIEFRPDFYDRQYLIVHLSGKNV